MLKLRARYPEKKKGPQNLIYKDTFNGIPLSELPQTPVSPKR